MPGRLTVCPTPIGNVDDLSPRARRALVEADIVACEDTRRAGRLFERLELEPPRLVSNYEGNTIYVDVTKDAVTNQGWDMIPTTPSLGETPAGERTM